MRKKKKKYANLIMLLLILFVLFFIVIQNRTVKVSIQELIQNYSSNAVEAYKKLLNQDLELSGKVKSFVQIEGKNRFMELQSTNDELKVYCILINKELETKAALQTTGTTVTIIGKCLGLKPDLIDKSSNSIYIEVEKIN
ncbi:MAG: hypothetical protein OQJ78_04345 [Ignavibacteriaceae bacterium]|nr:hypothetical protein [Ignavibacteriaceae bacterium]